MDTFRESDERRLYDDYKHYTDTEKIQLHAREQSQELEELFAQDAAEREAKAKAERSAVKKGVIPAKKQVPADDIDGA
jgi:glutathione-regulated potassium-efflux system protein KefB